MAYYHLAPLSQILPLVAVLQICALWHYSVYEERIRTGGLSKSM